MSKQQAPNRPKVVVFDIETTNFKADFGEIIHFAWNDLYDVDTPTQCIAAYETTSWNRDILDDSDLVRTAAGILDDADVIIGHYSRKFDLPFIQTRCLIHGIDPVDPTKRHVDTWHMARYRGAFGGNGMANIAEALDITPKVHVPKKTWRRANAGCIDALKELTDRCIGDVDTTIEMFHKLELISPTSFNVNIITGETDIACPKCGSKNHVKKGFALNKVSKFQRYKCMDCGKKYQDRVNLAIKSERVASQ